MKVTVAVVCFNEEKNIGDCLASLVGQSYERKLFEILCVDNGSTDRTQEIIKEWQKLRSPRHPEFISGSILKQVQNDSEVPIRLIVNPRRGIAISRNIAVKKAKYPLIAFTDADCIAPKNWLKKLVQGYREHRGKDSQVIAVGGSNVPPRGKRFYDTLALMLDSFWGSRNSVQGRVFKTDRYVAHLPCVNVLYEKEKIEAIGSFNETVFKDIIEDEDLSYRLKKRGYKFVYLSDTHVFHKLKDNFLDWAIKMFLYGRGRAWFLKKYPGEWNLFFAGPIILVLATAFGLTLPFRWLLLFPPFYLLATFLISYQRVLKAGKLFLLFDLFWLYLVTHFFYGLGEIVGFLTRI